jgi:hypothetical protein
MACSRTQDSRPGALYVGAAPGFYGICLANRAINSRSPTGAVAANYEHQANEEKAQ